MERRNFKTSTRTKRRGRTVIRFAGLILMIAANATNPAHAYGRDQLGSVNDYVNNNPNSSGADEFPVLGIAVTNGEGVIQGGREFDGAEIVDVVPGSPGATAGLKGEHGPDRELFAIVLAWLLFPPAMMMVAAFRSDGLRGAREFIIAVDGIRVHDIIEFREALNNAKPGEIVYLTIVSHGQRSQIRIRFPGGRTNSSFVVLEPHN
jgi:S1-C subfamily serine protease